MISASRFSARSLNLSSRKAVLRSQYARGRQRFQNDSLSSLRKQQFSTKQVANKNANFAKGTAFAAGGIVMISIAISSSGHDLALAEASGDDDVISRIKSFFGSSKTRDEEKDGSSETASDGQADQDKCCEGKEENKQNKVTIELDEELVESLPVISLEEVRKSNGQGGEERLLVSYEGIVYDITEFVNDHPGGKELALTAAGLDLEHFFVNYVVHGKTEKAAQWLAPLAVGKLSEEDALKSRMETNDIVHVEKRMNMLKKKRRKLVIIATTLPFWMTIRSMIRFVGWFIPPLGRLMAMLVPVTVPGLSKGSEPLKGDSEDYSVAVIGGGIAGCGAAWALTQSGFKVTLFEARQTTCGNARTFDWDFSPYTSDGEEKTVKSCVSVTAWPPVLYKNYTALLETLGIETVHQPLSWFINSKVPGYEGTLWEADPTMYEGSLRKVFESDFRKHKFVLDATRAVTNFFTLRWAPWRWGDTTSMYDMHQGLGLLNPLTMVSLYSLFKMVGGSDEYWDIIFTPQYTASFLVDELRPFPAVFGDVIDVQIPLFPNSTNSWQGKSKRSDNDCNITTCVTWKDAGNGVRKTFDKLTESADVKVNTRVRQVEVLPNGKKRVYDEYDGHVDVDRVIFACPANAVGNIHKSNSPLADTLLGSLSYADDHHPSTGHMHAFMHNDPNVIQEEYREDILKRASNYVEVTKLKDGSINIENTYNFGVQTPGPGVYDLPLDKKPVMLISHAMGEGKAINPELTLDTANHARAHPIYSGWNVAAQLSLRLIQGRNGIYYCSNWTTPGNCHDMSLLSGFICAHAVGAKYPFAHVKEAKKDFHRLRDLMGF